MGHPSPARVTVRPTPSQSYSLQGDAAMDRDLLDKHGEVVIDEKHKLDAYLARSGSSS
jgi:hypothetical protein